GDEPGDLFERWRIARDHRLATAATPRSGVPGRPLRHRARARRSRPDARLGRTVRRLACRDPGGRHVPLVVCPLGRLPGLPATTAVSQPVVDANARYFRADWDIIPNGVDTSLFRSNGERRRPMDALTDHPRLLFLGRIEPRNGLGTLLDAMPRILARFPGAVLTVVGD